AAGASSSPPPSSSASSPRTGPQGSSPGSDRADARTGDASPAPASGRHGRDATPAAASGKRAGGSAREQEAYQRVRPFIELLESSINRARRERLEREGASTPGDRNRGDAPADAAAATPGSAGGRDIAANGAAAAAARPIDRNGRSADADRRSDSDRLIGSTGPRPGVVPTPGSTNGPARAAGISPGNPNGSGLDRLTPAERRARSPYDVPGMTGDTGRSSGHGAWSAGHPAGGAGNAPGRPADTVPQPATPQSGNIDRNDGVTSPAAQNGPAGSAAEAGSASDEPESKQRPTEVPPRIPGLGSSGELRREPWRGKAKKAARRFPRPPKDG
ncbi:MAG: hypothetical protein ACOC0P_00830, partial [Planctomycetota bacterium]